MAFSLFTALFVAMATLIWHESWQVASIHLPYAMLLCGGLIFVAIIFMHTLVLQPLANLQRDLFPSVTSCLRRDRWIRWYWFFLFGFVLISFICATWAGLSHAMWIFPAWIVLFALALDILYLNWCHLLKFLDPTYLISQLVYEARKAIWTENDALFWNTLDNLTEVALCGVEKSQLALSTQVLKNIPTVIQVFFDSSKNIARNNQDQQIIKETGKDEASYTIFYLLQRLELINDKALQVNLEPLCRQMILTVSKLIILGAKFDLSMVGFPTNLLTKLGLKAQQHHYNEVTFLTISSLMEIAKIILTDKDINLTYAELQYPFQAIVSGLATIARQIFQKDKTTNIPLLMQPLTELREFILSSRAATHKDSAKIVQDINNVLDEFRILNEMMQTLPSIQPETESPNN